eukprot:5602796-Pleurochrysis_carterae.AAC.2
MLLSPHAVALVLMRTRHIPATLRASVPPRRRLTVPPTLARTLSLPLFSLPLPRFHLSLVFTRASSAQSLNLRSLRCSHSPPFRPLSSVSSPDLVHSPPFRRNRPECPKRRRPHPPPCATVYRARPMLPATHRVTNSFAAFKHVSERALFRPAHSRTQFTSKTTQLATLVTASPTPSAGQTTPTLPATWSTSATCTARPRVAPPAANRRGPACGVIAPPPRAALGRCRSDCFLPHLVLPRRPRSPPLPVHRPSRAHLLLHAPVTLHALKIVRQPRLRLCAFRGSALSLSPLPLSAVARASTRFAKPVPTTFPTLVLITA